MLVFYYQHDISKSDASDRLLSKHQTIEINPQACGSPITDPKVIDRNIAAASEILDGCFGVSFGRGRLELKKFFLTQL